MIVNIRIEDDEQFRAHVKSLIEGQVRHVLREQLSGIVAGEIAKLRILQPNSPTLSTLVEAEIKKHGAVKSSASAVAAEIRSQVTARITAEVLPSVKALRAEIIDTMRRGLA